MRAVVLIIDPFIPFLIKILNKLRAPAGIFNAARILIHFYWTPFHSELFYLRPAHGKHFK